MIADVVLPDGTFLANVVFDGDSRLAVEIEGRRITELPSHFGRPIADLFVVTSHVPGVRPFDAQQGHDLSSRASTVRAWPQNIARRACPAGRAMEHRI